MSLKVIGITGGIGSGKSTVCRIFESFGYKIYKADDRSRGLLDNDPSIHAAVRELLGDEVFSEDGKPDRKKIAAEVFGKKKKLEALNAILHPSVKKDFDAWLKSAGEGYGKSFVLKEAAILFEAGTHEGLDKIIEVYAPLSLRVSRVMERDQVKEKAVLERMKNQWPEWKKIHLSDFIIFNDGVHMLIPQVQKAIEWLEQA